MNQLPTTQVTDSGQVEARTQEAARLPRTLNAFTLTFIFVAFGCPLAVLAGYLQPVIAFGNGLGAPVAFLGAGAILIVFQIGSLAMSRHMKRPGAFYTYIAEGMGKPAGLAGSFLAGIAYLMLALSGNIFFGLIAESLAKQLFGSSPFSWQVWALLAFALVAVLNLLRIDISAKVISVFVCLEIIIVAAYQATVMIQGGPEGYSLSSFLPSEFLSGSPGIAILFALTTMIGIESMAVFREEAKDPEKTIPRAAYAAITGTALFFALTAWAYIIAVGPSNAINDARTAPVDSVLGTIQTYMGGFMPTLVAVLLVTSQLASCNSVQALSVRYIFALGRDGVLPARLGKVSRKWGSPHNAVFASVGISLAVYLVLISFSDDVVLIYSSTGAFGTIFMLPLMLGASASVIFFFRRKRGLENSWKSLVAPVVSCVTLAAVLVLVLLNLDVMFSSQILGTICSLSLIVVVAGGVLLGLWFKNRRPQVYAAIGNQDV